MSEDKKVKKICRVCLGTSVKKCMSLFEKYKDYLIFDYVNSIANVKIKENDGLPDKICLDCLMELETAINFKQKCESSNIILQTAQVDTNSVADVEIEIKNIVIKKEEPAEEPFEYLEGDAHFFDASELLEDETDLLSDNSNDKILRKSRAIDLRLECHECGNHFKSKCKLRVHWKKVHLPEALVCQICKRAFKAFQPYNRHIKNGGKSCSVAATVRIEGVGKTRVFHCKECQYKSRRIKDIQTHLVTHSGDRPFKCDQCPSSYTQQSSLQGHKEMSHNEYKVEITCQYCGKFVRGRTRVYRHLKTHTDDHHKCPVCAKILRSKKNLQTHMQRHSGVKTFTCEKCAKSFYTCAELCNHRRMIHNKGKYWYYCDMCEYKSIRSEKIKKHKVKHTSTNISCVVCGMFFDTQEKHILHQRIHFGERKYGCPYCERRFFRKDTVNKHIRAKHKCTLAPSLGEKSVMIKKEAPVANTEEIIEIEVPPVIEIK